MHFLWSGLVLAAVARPAASQPAALALEVSTWPAAGYVASSPAALPRQDDPAASLYKEGTREINRKDFQNAARIFARITSRYPKSRYAPEAFYWHAFALYRIGDHRSLRTARDVLQALKRKHPKEFSRGGDAVSLEQRILGELAKRGDRDARKAIGERSQQAARGNGSRSPANCSLDRGGVGSNNAKVTALNALVQIDTARALSTLKEVLRRHDPESTCLRRMVVPLVAKHRSEGAESILLDAARKDPDQQVREQAVLYLSRFETERSLRALDEITRSSEDSGIVARAVLALSESDHPRAQAALRTYAMRDDVPDDSRRRAVVALLRHRASSKDKDNTAFFRKLYSRLDNAPELRGSILESLSRKSDPETARWLFDVVRDDSESMELRLQALTAAARAGPIDNRMKLYTPALERQWRARLLEVYSRHNEEAAALDELGEMAKHDPDRELRRNAVQAISRSKSPYAAEVLQKIVIGK